MEYDHAALFTFENNRELRKIEKSFAQQFDTRRLDQYLLVIIEHFIATVNNNRSLSLSLSLSLSSVVSDNPPASTGGGGPRV